MTSLAAMTHQVNDLTEKIWPNVAPLLAGKPPEVQSAVLADLTAIWLAGFPACHREVLLATFVEFVRQLTPVNERMMTGQFWPAGNPEDPE